MKNRKHFISIVLLCIVAVAVIASVFIFGKKAEYVSQVDENEVTAAFNLLNNSLRTKTVNYTDFLADTTADFGQGDINAQPEAGTEVENYDGLTNTLDYEDTITYTVKVDNAGLYYLLLDYKPMGNSLADFVIDVKVNGAQVYEEMKNIGLPLFWSDETKDFPTDRYGDQTAPRQIKKDDWTSLYLYNSSFNTSDPLLFPLESGTNTITVKNNSGNGLGIGRLQLRAPVDNIPNYSEYRKQNNGSLVTALVPINSVDYIEKNTTQAIYSSENNPALIPHDSEYKLLNTLTWTDAGSEVTYQLKAPENGYYQIAFRYKSAKEEFDVFNTIKIDGTVPFKEFTNYKFGSTGSKWMNEVLSDKEGVPYEIYFTKGIHTLTLHAEQEPVVKAFQYARLIAEHVTQFELEITKITGSTDDKNRTWQMTRYIPEIADYLASYKTLINEIKYSLQEYSLNGANSAMFSELDKAIAFIDQMAEYPDEIALYKQNLTKNRDNSVLKSVSDFASKIVAQNFGLNQIYVYGNHDLPKPRANIFETVWNSTKTLANTFISDKFDTKNDPEALNIWVRRASTHVDLMQKMADTEFTPKYGIKVKINVMPDQNKLVLASAAGDTPDMALGLDSHIPFELASRGTLYDLTQFDDFWDIQGRFVPGASVSYIYNEGMYGIPETMDFHTIIYRTDILDEIGLTPPNTWQDVTDMLPTLQRYGMNFYHNIAGGVGYKWYHQTTSLIFQNNGRLYSEDGLRTAIDQPDAVKGIQALGDLFIAYSLPKEVVSFFNSFKSGIYPVGIVSLADYILFKNGAPELDGQWALAPYPGTVQADDSISRWYIANGNAGVIFKDTDKAEEAWEFMKWWTDYETQVNYTYTLQSTYGKAFVWLSSNVDAIVDSPFEQADKQVIVEQIKWLRDTPRTPGQYLLERSISDIWNDMINNGTSAQVAIDERVIDINREIKKKMNELGYYDEQGNLLRPYVIRDYDWIAEQVEKAKQEGE
ncbi:MAG: transporter, substrate-binding protein [Herbinix sp.]|jgi:ABC-type glycerol-3-phosphate transport system substrate-binding protein|nr:transporter, substrate-binding protein [Herbinix sp.]